MIRWIRRLSLAVLTTFLAIGPVVHASSWEVDETAFVMGVIDGDTLSTGSLGRIRLADIDAPETGEPGAVEATSYLISLVNRQWVYLDIDDLHVRDEYGRHIVVAYVRYNESHLLNVNKALLESGVVKVSDFPNEFDPDTWALYVFHRDDVTLTNEFWHVKWVLGAGFLALQIYYWGTLARAWIEERRAGATLVSLQQSAK